MERVYQVLLAVVVLPLLGGCTTGLALMAMEGPAMCPPEVIRQAPRVQHELAYATPGARQYELEILLGQPFSREQTQLKDGRAVEILLYRTNHSACTTAGLTPDFTPVVFVEHTFVGAGEDFVTSELSPHLAGSESHF